MQAAITQFISYVKRRYGNGKTAKDYENDLNIFSRTRTIKQRAKL